jgi:hypothetical protein
MRASTLLFLTVSVFAANILQAQQAPDAPSGRAIELSLSNKAGELRLRNPESFRGQTGEAQYALFISEDRDLVGSAGLFVDTDLNFGPVSARLGPQVYAALLNVENQDVFALALGAVIRCDVFKRQGIAIVGAANWSPDITTFGSANNLTDLMARAEIRVSKNFVGFAGYRWFRLDLTEPDITASNRLTLQNEVFAGLQWRR